MIAHDLSVSEVLFSLVFILLASSLLLLSSVVQVVQGHPRLSGAGKCQILLEVPSGSGGAGAASPPRI